MTAHEFARAYPGEGDHIEFKRGFSSRRLQEPVVAFSNADGGVILLGVDLDGTVFGVAHPGELARSVYQAISEVVDPGQHEVHHLGVGDKVVLAVAVDRRREGFAQMPGGSVRDPSRPSVDPVAGLAAGAGHHPETSATSRRRETRL